MPGVLEPACQRIYQERDLEERSCAHTVASDGEHPYIPEEDAAGHAPESKPPPPPPRPGAEGMIPGLKSVAPSARPASRPQGLLTDLGSCARPRGSSACGTRSGRLCEHAVSALGGIPLHP